MSRTLLMLFLLPQFVLPLYAAQSAHDTPPTPASKEKPKPKASPRTQWQSLISGLSRGRTKDGIHLRDIGVSVNTTDWTEDQEMEGKSMGVNIDLSLMQSDIYLDTRAGGQEMINLDATGVLKIETQISNDDGQEYLYLSFRSWECKTIIEPRAGLHLSHLSMAAATVEISSDPTLGLENMASLEWFDLGQAYSWRPSANSDFSITCGVNMAPLRLESATSEDGGEAAAIAASGAFDLRIRSERLGSLGAGYGLNQNYLGDSLRTAEVYLGYTSPFSNSGWQFHTELAKRSFDIDGDEYEKSRVLSFGFNWSPPSPTSRARRATEYRYRNRVRRY